MNSRPDQSPRPDAEFGPTPPSASDQPTRAGHPSAGDSPSEPLQAETGGIEGYVLKEEIHRGGQGVVYRAIQLGTKRQVALKVLLEGQFAGQTSRQRFEREVELAASLRHPNIVTILDSGLSRGCYYFAMEYVEGTPLDRYLAQKRPSLNQALTLFVQVCEAVNFAHQRGVIHRDLKPPNILVDAEGQPHILDFGLAKPVFPLASADSTVQMISTSGQLLGTVAYMSPEQAAGSQDVDVRSDVYSLGVVFYEALVGSPPYPVDGPLGEILIRIASLDPANPRSMPARLAGSPKIDDELATILLKALEKEPHRRYQSAGELAADLRRRLRGEPIEAKRASGLYMLKKTLRRYRLESATAGLILLMLVGFLITLTVLWGRERQARRQADLKTEETRQAVIRQNEALQQARQRATEAMLAQQDLRRALLRQHIQRGDLALTRGDLREARESYWQALELTPAPAAIWALRRYYLQSADRGAEVLALQSEASAASLPSVGATAPQFFPGGNAADLSPNGQIAAVCPTPTSILVRDLQTGADLAWVPAPGPVTTLNIQDDGALAAAGQGWARAWQPGALRASVSAQLLEFDTPPAVFPVTGGQELLLVGPRFVRLFSGPDGQTRQVLPLRGTRTAPPDYAPKWRQVAVPTSAGVELIWILEDGSLRSDLVWTGNSPAKAIRFDGDELLAVLADAVYVARVPELGVGQWLRFIDPPAGFELLDLKTGSGTIVLAATDGRLALYRGGQPIDNWRCGAGGLTQVRLSSSGPTVLTLDDRQTVTRWSAEGHVEQRRLVHPGSPTAWASASDGSTVLAATDRGRVIAISAIQSPLGSADAREAAAPPPAAGPRVRTVLRPRLLAPSHEPPSLAIDAAGHRAVVRERATVRLIELDDLESTNLSWNDRTYAVADKVALRGDGRLIALLVRGRSGDPQRIVFRNWPARPDQQPQAPPPDSRDSFEDPTAPPPVDFVGAAVRELAFIPGTGRLLVARSNGQLIAIDPEKAAGQQPASGPDPTGAVLDSPPRIMAFSRTGEYLALACEDHFIRLIMLPRLDVRRRLPVGRPASALAFNPRDDILLVRTIDGAVHLFDPATGENLASWSASVSSGRPFGAWSGDEADAILLNQADGIYEYRYAAADAAIERDRAYACQQQIVRALSQRQDDAAREAVQQLLAIDPQRGQSAQVALLEANLRRPGATCWPEWAQAVLAQAPALTWLRLGHAAYDGERFKLARQWLAEGCRLAAASELEVERGPALDAVSLLRLAQCDYLSEDYRRAAAGFAQVLAAEDADPSTLPTVALQLVAALTLAGQLTEARQAALRIGRQDELGREVDLVALTYANLIACRMAGVERDDPRATALDSLVGTFGERSLLFQEDEYFFAAETLRQRGDLFNAAVQYQRCIDLARDVWPANWARYRLSTLPQPTAAGPASPAWQ